MAKIPMVINIPNDKLDDFIAVMEPYITNYIANPAITNNADKLREYVRLHLKRTYLDLRKASFQKSQSQDVNQDLADGKTFIADMTVEES